MRLADQNGVIALALQQIACGKHIFQEFDADRPATVPGGIEAGEDRRSGGGTDRVVAVGALERGALCGQAVQVGCPNPGIDNAQCTMVLLVGGDEQDVG